MQLKKFIEFYIKRGSLTGINNLVLNQQ